MNNTNNYNIGRSPGLSIRPNEKYFLFEIKRRRLPANPDLGGFNDIFDL